MGESTRTPDAGLRPKTLAWLQASIGLIGFAAVLELAPRIGLVSPRYLPPFSVIAAALATELQQGNFWAALAFTMRSWAIGLSTAVLAGAVLGIVIGSFAWLQAVTRSTIEFLRPIPSVALIPIAILLFGTTLQSNLVLVIYASFWQVLVQVLSGVQDVDPVARETAQSYRFSHWALIRHVVWPTTLPYLMTGIRLAASVALILAITAELTIGTPGLGRELALAQSGGAVAVMYAYLIVMGLIGVLVNLAARGLERSIMPWHPSLRSEEPA
jgi:ABC-type nitrate/sulfonate/bicarbonate transport system permease component